MLSVVEPVVLFVRNLDRSIAYYNVVLGEKPRYRDGRSVSYSVGGEANMILVKSDHPVRPQSAILLCEGIANYIKEWGQWVGMIDLFCSRTNWPIQLAVLRDPDDNTLIVLETSGNQGL